MDSEPIITDGIAGECLDIMIVYFSNGNMETDCMQDFCMRPSKLQKPWASS